MLFITVYMRVEVLRYVIQAVGFVLEVFWMFETSLDVSCIFKYFVLFFAEILLSLLLQVSELNFQLCIKVRFSRLLTLDL